MNTNQIEDYLRKNGFAEMQTKPGVWTKEKAPNMRMVDLNKTPPQVCVFTGTERMEEGHGIPEIDLIRNELKAIMEPKKEKKENAPPEKKPDPEKIEKTETKPSGILELIQKYAGNDVLEIFGETGSGKSKFCLEVARQAIASSKTVFYLDTERNLTDDDIASLRGCQYKYTPVLDEIDRIVMRELPKVDVVILDSIGFPVLTTYARLSLKQKGDALLKLIAIFGDLKKWAYLNSGIVIVTNQPESEFNKEPGHVFRPFGDKSQFAAKEIWKSSIVQRTPENTKIQLSAFRSRCVGHGTHIATMDISMAGVEVKK